MMFQAETSTTFIEDDGSAHEVPLTGKVIRHPYEEFDFLDEWLELSNKVCDGQGPYLCINKRHRNVGMVVLDEPMTLVQARLIAAIKNLPLYWRCEMLDQHGYANTEFKEVKLS